MCEFCFDDDTVGQADLADITPALMVDIRAYERELDGVKVPEAAWTIFFGQASGSVLWPHYERMAACRTAVLARPVLGFRRRNARATRFVGAVARPN